MHQAFVVTPVQGGVEDEGVLAFFQSASCMAHDMGVRASFQAAQQFAHVLGVGKRRCVGTAKGPHGCHAVQQGGGTLPGHLAPQQGLDVADLEAPGPVDEEGTGRTGERTQQHHGLFQQAGDDALLQGAQVVAGHDLRQLGQAAGAQGLGKIGALGA